MIVNPHKLIYPKSGYLGILPSTEESLELLEKTFYSVLKKSPFERNMSRHYLTRVDLCTNIHCDRQDVFRELVRLLRKTATPKKYERKYYQNPDKKKANHYSKHYIRIACGSQKPVIYDKTYHMTENDLSEVTNGLHSGRANPRYLLSSHLLSHSVGFEIEKDAAGCRAFSHNHYCKEIFSHASHIPAIHHQI